MRSDSCLLGGISKRHCGSALRISLVCLLVSACLLPCVSCRKSIEVEGRNDTPNTAAEQNVTGLIASEDLILDLTPQLKLIALWIEQRAGDAVSELPILSDLVAVQGLKTVDGEKLFGQHGKYPEFLEKANWPVASEASSEVGYPWASLDRLGIKWETMKFGVLSGGFESENVFSIHSKVEGRGESSRAVWGIKGHQDFIFERKDESWKLTKWLQGDLVLERSAQPLFREVLSEVVPDSETLKEIRRSHKDEIIVRSSRKGGTITLPVPLVADWEELPSNHVFPSVAVVEYNSDGLDDLFLPP